MFDGGALGLLRLGAVGHRREAETRAQQELSARRGPAGSPERIHRQRPRVTARLPPRARMSSSILRDLRRDRVLPSSEGDYREQARRVLEGSQASRVQGAYRVSAPF
jgi:hypothetical protein